MPDLTIIPPEGKKTRPDQSRVIITRHCHRNWQRSLTTDVDRAGAVHGSGVVAPSPSPSPTNTTTPLLLSPSSSPRSSSSVSSSLSKSRASPSVTSSHRQGLRLRCIRRGSHLCGCCCCDAVVVCFLMSWKLVFLVCYLYCRDAYVFCHLSLHCSLFCNLIVAWSTCHFIVSSSTISLSAVSCCLLCHCFLLCGPIVGGMCFHCPVFYCSIVFCLLLHRLWSSLVVPRTRTTKGKRERGKRGGEGMR